MSLIYVASASGFESGNATQIAGRVLPHGSNNSLVDKTTNDTAVGGDTTAVASESESKSGHAMQTNGRVLPHGSNNSLAGK